MGREKQVVIQENQQSLSKSVIEVCPVGLHTTNLQALVPAQPPTSVVNGCRDLTCLQPAPEAASHQVWQAVGRTWQ